MAYNRATTSHARKKQSIATPASTQTPPNATKARTASSTPLAAYATNDDGAEGQQLERPYYENSDEADEGYERRTNIMEVAERRRQLEEDDWTAEVEPKRVRCRGCKRWIKLDGRSLYYRGFWEKHRDLCRAIKRILGVPVPQRARRLYTGSGSTKRARGTTPARPTTKVYQKAKASDSSHPVKPGAQVRAPPQAGESDNAIREVSLSAHSIQDVPAALGYCLSTRIDEDRDPSDTFSFTSAEQTSVFADGADRLPLAFNNLVASVWNNRRLDSVAETESYIAASMQAVCDKGKSRATWSRSVGRMDVEEHPVMGRRIVPGSGRENQAVAHCKQWWEAGDAQPNLMGPGLPARHPENSAGPGGDQRTISSFSETHTTQDGVLEAPFIDQLYIGEDPSNRTPPPHEEGNKIASRGLAWARNSHQDLRINPTGSGSRSPSGCNVEPTGIMDDERSYSATPPLHGIEQDAPGTSSSFRHDVEGRQSTSKRTHGWDRPRNQPVQRKHTHDRIPTTCDGDRTVFTPSISHQLHVNEPKTLEASFRWDFEQGGPRNAQRYARSTEFASYGNSFAVTPNSQDDQPRGSRALSAMRETREYTGDRLAQDEDTRHPIIPAPLWANIAQIDLVDPRIPVQLDEQSSGAANGGQTESKVARGRGPWGDDDEEYDEEGWDDTNEKQGVFAPEIPDRCPTVSCHHRFRFSSQQELNTYFDGATVESMAKNTPSVEPDVLKGGRCLAFWAVSMQ